MGPKGIAGIDAFAEVFIEKGENAFLFLILGDMHALMNEDEAIVRHVLAQINTITDSHARGAFAEKADPFRDEHDIVVVGLWKSLHKQDANLLGMSDSGAAGIRQLAFGQWYADIEDDAFLFFDPGMDNRQQTLNGGKEAMHGQALLISEMGGVAQGCGESFQIITPTDFDGTQSRGEGRKHLRVEKFKFPGMQMCHEMAEGDLGGVRHAMEHRFTGKETIDGHTIDAADQRIFFPDLDAVGMSLAMEFAVGLDETGADSGGITTGHGFRAGVNHRAEILIDGQPERIVLQLGFKPLGRAKGVDLKNRAWIR